MLVALEQFQKLGSALACPTGQDEGQIVDHLVKRVSIILQKGLASMLLNRVPGQWSPPLGGRWTTVYNIIRPDQ